MENLLKYSLITHGSGADGNIILNIFLIPSYSGFGAAIATLNIVHYIFILIFISYAKNKSYGNYDDKSNAVTTKIYEIQSRI